MAEKRMFTQKIVDSDAFLDMPLSAQALYFHLNMRADDDGFVNNPKKVQRVIGASEDDLKLLVVKRFILTFQSGVIVIKHWRMHNTLKSDRYKPTDYQEEFALLGMKSNKAYTEISKLEPNRNQTVSNPEPQNRIDKNRLDLDKIRKENNNSFFLSSGEISENAPEEQDPGAELREKVAASMRRIAEKRGEAV